MADRNTITAEDIDETARLLGVKPGERKDDQHSPDDIVDTARALGIKLKTKSVATPKPGQVLPDVPTATPLGQDPWVSSQPRRYLRGVAQSALEGVPVAGPAVEHGIAALMPGRYGANIENIQNEGKAFSEANPSSALISNLVGGAVGTLPAAMTKIGGALLGTYGPSFGSKVMTGGAGGSLIGLTDAGLRGEDPVEGGKIGGMFGVGAPLVGKGAHAGLNWLVNQLPRTGPLRNISPTAVSKLTGAMEGETPASLAEARRRMGPAGFMADVNPAMTDIAGGIADTPGPGKTLVREAFRGRAKEQATRMADSIDTHVGPSVNLVDLEHVILDERKKTSEPLYKAFSTTTIPTTPEIEKLIPRLEKAGAFKLAEEMSGITGRPLNRANLTPEGWNDIKIGLDRAIDAAYNKDDKKLAGALVGLKHEMLGEIEKTPGGKIWKKAREQWAEKSELIDQMRAGRDTFLGGRSGLTADELEEELKGLSKPERMARLAGMRAALDEGIGATVTGDTITRNKLLSDNNKKKLRLMAGKKEGDAVIETMEQEKYLGDQGSNVIGNIQTGASAPMRSQRVKALEAPAVEPWNLDLGKPGSYLPPSWRREFEIHNIRNAWRGQKYQRAANELAPLITTPASDPNFDAIVAALYREQSRRALTDARAGQAGNALTGLVSGPVSTTVRRRSAQ